MQTNGGNEWHEVDGARNVDNDKYEKKDHRATMGSFMNSLTRSSWQAHAQLGWSLLPAKDHPSEAVGVLPNLQLKVGREDPDSWHRLAGAADIA